MTSIIDYIKLIRPFNILIVFFTQLLLYILVVFNKINFPALDLKLALLLSFCTCLITACGYIINDYFDQDIDKINKPTDIIIGNKIGDSQALYFYYSLIGVGSILSIYIAYKTSNFHLLPIYPMAHLLLYFYAKKWKLSGLIGNNIVALMTSFVAWIIIIAERKEIFSSENNESLSLIIAFGLFSYMINLVREVIKDLEDIEGDKIKNSASIPIASGIESAKVVIYFNTTILFLFLNFFLFYYNHSIIAMLYSILFLQLPFLYLLYKTNKAKRKNDYKFISQFTKGIMLSGLIYLCLLSNNL
jgi:4-hydroxybenzoate polyprenyltransferase